MAAHLAGGEIDALHQRHDLFHALLQINLTVLATAHAVSEGIMRGVHDEVTRKSAPQTYGASGRPAAPPRSAAQPLAGPAGFSNGMIPKSRNRFSGKIMLK